MFTAKKSKQFFFSPKKLESGIRAGASWQKMGCKKIQMEPRGFQKMKLRFPSSAVYMENLRETVTNLWFGDKVSKIRDLKIKVGAPEQLPYYTRPMSRRF